MSSGNVVYNDSLENSANVAATYGAAVVGFASTSVQCNISNLTSKTTLDTGVNHGGIFGFFDNSNGSFNNVYFNGSFNNI